MTWDGGIWARLARYADERPNDTALIFLADGETETSRWSFGDLHRRALMIAGRLRKLDAVGRPVMLAYPPGLEFCAALFGAFAAGAIPVAAPFRPRRVLTDRMRAMVFDAQPVVVLAQDLAGCAPYAADSWPVLATGELEVSQADGVALSPAADDLAFLQYTSGSTGGAKGVIVSHANLAANLQSMCDTFGVDESATGVTWLPLFHDMGLVTMLTAIHAGRPCILMPPQAFLQSPLRWLKAITRYRATFSGAPNFAFDRCVSSLAGGAAPDLELDLSHWRAAFCGAEPVRWRTMRAFAEAFTPFGLDPCALTPCYGLAEATLLAASTPLDAPPSIDMDGRVVCGSAAGCELRIVDPQTGLEAPLGTMGEVWVRGDSVARGYWNAPEATAAVFGAHLPGVGGGFLRTGDQGYLGEGGLYLCGRLKDILVHRGVNIDPDDVERAAASVSPVMSVTGAAFPVEIDDEERVVLVHEIDRRAFVEADLEAVADGVAEAVATQTGLSLHDLVLVRPGAIPRTTSGKVQRRLCREIYLSGVYKTAQAGPDLTPLTDTQTMVSGG
jgi:acyl-CoA synthetase (AMP-forming)/AMP-acid ligase II